MDWLEQKANALFGGGAQTAGQLAQADPAATFSGPMNAPAGYGGGFFDYTGDSGSKRGDEVEDTADLMMYIAQGASRSLVLAEARRRRYTRADFNAVMRVQSTAAKVANLMSLNADTESGIPKPAFFQLADILDRVLKGRRRRKRMMGLKTMLVAAHQLGQVAHAIMRAGRGIASLHRPVVMTHAGHKAKHQLFTTGHRN